MQNKSVIRPIIIAVLALTAAFAFTWAQSSKPSLPAQSGAGHRDKPAAEPFQIRIVDQQTGVAVPHVRLTTDNGIICYTGKDGNVTWSESSLMDRDVYFKIDRPGFRFPGGGKAIPVTHGGHVELKISR